MNKQKIEEAVDRIIDDVEGKYVDEKAKKYIVSFFKEIKAGNLKSITEKKLSKLRNTVEEVFISNYFGIYIEIDTFLDEIGLNKKNKTNKLPS